MFTLLTAAQVRWAKHQEQVRLTRAAMEAADQAFPSRLDSMDRGRVDPLGPTPAQVNRVSAALEGLPSQYRR